ncbi:MAG: hypothetical protein NZ578_00815 [Candidatus Binatia bacterium]|nr:hypothetical protein [Candidatus Binatia bacterium]
MVTWLVATALVALMSEFLVGAVEHTARTFGMTDVDVILVAIIGNAAEHGTAILVAAKNQMDLALNDRLEYPDRALCRAAPRLSRRPVRPTPVVHHVRGRDADGRHRQPRGSGRGVALDGGSAIIGRLCDPRRGVLFLAASSSRSVNPTSRTRS